MVMHPWIDHLTYPSLDAKYSWLAPMSIVTMLVTMLQEYQELFSLSTVTMPLFIGCARNNDLLRHHPLEVNLYGPVWSGLVWYGMFRSGLVCSGLVWSGLVRYGPVQSGLVRSGLVWSGPVRSALVWYFLVLSGLIWYGPVWSGLFWYGLVWSDPSIRSRRSGDVLWRRELPDWFRGGGGGGAKGERPSRRQ